MRRPHHANVTHDLDAEVPTASRKFPAKYLVTSKGRPKEQWYLYDTDAPKDVIKAWRDRVASKCVDEVISKKSKVLETEFKSILSKPSNKDKRKMFCMHPDPQEDDVKSAIEDSRQYLYREWGLTRDGDDDLDGGAETQLLEQEVPPDAVADADIGVGTEVDVAMDDIYGEYHKSNGVETGEFTGAHSRDFLTCKYYCHDCECHFHDLMEAL